MADSIYPQFSDNPGTLDQHSKTAGALPLGGYGFMAVCSRVMTLNICLRAT